MEFHKSQKKKWALRIAAVVVIALGLVLGVTWNAEKFCIGDYVFMALGLPAWSNGTSGGHYPAIVGSIFLVIGITMLNMTLREKIRFWLWAIVVLILVILNLGFAV